MNQNFIGQPMTMTLASGETVICEMIYTRNDLGRIYWSNSGWTVMHQADTFMIIAKFHRIPKDYRLYIYPEKLDRRLVPSVVDQNPYIMICYKHEPYFLLVSDKWEGDPD